MKFSENSRLLAFAILGAILCAASFQFDNAVVAWVAAHPSHSLRHAAQCFTKWGDFLPIAALLLVLFFIACLLERTFVISTLMLMLLSASAGGIAANIIRLLTGRARPSARVPPGWYGFTDHGAWIAGSYAYSAFPSAHTTVAIACIVPLWLLLPPLHRLLVALPATLIALCIAASRILLGAHHLSDVLTGAWLGILIATLLCNRLTNPPHNISDLSR